MYDVTLTRRPQPPTSAWGRRRRRAATWVVLAVCLVLAAACGGDDGDQAGSDVGPLVTEFKGDPNRACELATETEVEAAVAAKVRAGVGDAGTICTYTLETSFDEYVVLERTESPQSAQIFDLHKTSGDAVEPLTGVGNDAFVAGNKAYVLKGTVLAGITVNVKQPQPAISAAVKKLAQAAALHA